MVYSVNLMRRDEAQARGEIRYNTGTPCKRGHMSDRWVSNGACISCSTRKVMRANRVRSVLPITFPVPATLDAAARAEVELVAHRAVEAWHVARGLQYPIAVDAFRWAEQFKRPISECPFL